METEHSLLDQISRKEAELKGQCDIVCKEAETKIHDARVLARSKREETEKKSAEEASRYMQEGLGELEKQIRSIQEAGEQEADGILDKGKKNLDSAVERITEMVLG